MLNHITDGNIDMYKELLRGNYSIFKDKDADNVKLRQENDLYVEDIEILEKHVPIILSLYKHYDCDTISDIYEYCIDYKNNRLNFTKLRRIQRFVSIESSRKKKRLDFPVLKFIKDSQAWAKEHPQVSKREIEVFLAEWTCKWCNSIKNVIVDDLQYAETMFELVKEYWDIIVVHSRPKNGILTIQPFELIWKTKQQLNNIYGDWNTQTFFLQELMDDMKEEDNTEEDEEIIPEFEHNEKVKLEDIINELPEIIHKEFDYFNYSKLDQSNDRFIRKQENTNQMRDQLFSYLLPPEEKKDNKNKNESLTIQFNEFENEEIPF